VFTPQAIFKSVDLTGGTLNYANYECMHDVEREVMGLLDQSLFQCILPSSSTLIKVGAKVEKVADAILPVDFFKTKREKDFGPQMWPKRLSCCSRIMICMKRQNVSVLS
jgi:hypothetical protein